METGVHELTAGYALDALDAEERRAYEAHLEGCARCRGGSPPSGRRRRRSPSPRPGLRPARRSATASSRARARSRRSSSRSLPAERSVPVLAAAAAVAAVVALAVGLWAASLSGDLDETRDPQARARGGACWPTRMHGRSRSRKARDASSWVPEAVLVLDGVDPAPAGQTYEMWIVAGGAAAPAGLFPGRDGTGVVLLDGRVGVGSVVAVTVEEEGGVDAPTTEPIAASQPV